jgi:virulence-associated protein VapD
MAGTRKQIAFDLDTNALKIYYPAEHWQSAYDKIKRHMAKYGFEWKQGSVYHSKSAMNDSVPTAAIADLVKANPWLNICMRDCVVTNIGREYDRNILFDKSVSVAAREELKGKADKTSMDKTSGLERIKAMGNRSEKRNDESVKHIEI